MRRSIYRHLGPLCPKGDGGGGFKIPALTPALWGQEVGPLGLRLDGGVLPCGSNFNEVRRVRGVSVWGLGGGFEMTSGRLGPAFGNAVFPELSPPIHLVPPQ